MRKGLLFVVSAPSGSGKTTLCRKMVETLPDLSFSVSATTRPMRRGERNYVDYHFVSAEEFKKMVERGEFAEWAVYLDNYYGTPKSEIERIWQKGKDVVLEIDVQGGIQIREKYPTRSVLIYVMLSSLKLLEDRLRARGTDTEEEIAKRLITARRELEYKDKYDYVVLNDDLEDATEKMRAIVIAERCRTRKE
ncbi:MAG: guanylate kinase [bacterium]